MTQEKQDQEQDQDIFASVPDVEVEQIDEPDERREVEEEDSDFVPDDAEEIQEVRSALKIDEHIDPLDALLGLDIGEEVTDTHTVKRLGVQFTISAIMDDRDYDKLVDRCTTWHKRKGQARYRELDVRRLARLVVAGYVLDPPFTPENDRGRGKYQRLANKFGVEEPETLVRACLLPGEIDALSDHILNLSGFDDDVEQAGN